MTDDNDLFTKLKKLNSEGCVIHGMHKSNENPAIDVYYVYGMRL